MLSTVSMLPAPRPAFSARASISGRKCGLLSTPMTDARDLAPVVAGNLIVHAGAELQDHALALGHERDNGRCALEPLEEVIYANSSTGQPRFHLLRVRVLEGRVSGVTLLIVLYHRWKPASWSFGKLKRSPYRPSR